METSLDSVYQYLTLNNTLPEKEWADFSKIWQPFSSKRQAILTEVGNKEKYLYFVLSGVQRICAIDKKGKEATLILTYPYSFGGIIDSFLLQTSSNYSYECLSHSSFLRSTYQQLNEISNTYPNIDAILKYYQLKSGRLKIRTISPLTILKKYYSSYHFA
ncbi:MAG: hypothetical protein GY810_28355 [Aureispira sp.]|nr:hypothetical protein [Aureispira sp.]